MLSLSCVCVCVFVWVGVVSSCVHGSFVVGSGVDSSGGNGSWETANPVQGDNKQPVLCCLSLCKELMHFGAAKKKRMKFVGSA